MKFDKVMDKIVSITLVTALIFAVVIAIILMIGFARYLFLSSSNNKGNITTAERQGADECKCQCCIHGCGVFELDSLNGKDKLIFRFQPIPTE